MLNPAINEADIPNYLHSVLVTDTTAPIQTPDPILDRFQLLPMPPAHRLLPELRRALLHPAPEIRI